ncbi:alpha/beta hydrolase fold domain-containing protein [Streptomyces sp. NPDC002680]|uniref:alpha/beta hydrolase fold domain-containing protein n=1 Tax=Streptomyces sp. NPDC002680 TaxID=3364659 RepID=UPI00369E3FF0
MEPDARATGPARARVATAHRSGDPAVLTQARTDRPHTPSQPAPAQPDLTDVRTEPGGAADELGPVRVESSPIGPIVRPTDPTDLVILYLHGDRHLSGTPESALDLAERLALRTGAVVVCPRYRSSFPGALDDVHAVYDSCRARGPVALAGERLGGGLAASLLVRLRDMGAAAPQCAVLGSALLDLTLDAPSLLFNAAAEPSFDVDELRLRAALYAAGTEPTNPLLSPLHANLHGLPPVQLLVAGTDPLLDDSLGFAARAARSGVTVDLRVREDAERLRPEAVAAMAGFILAWTRSEGSSRPA